MGYTLGNLRTRKEEETKVTETTYTPSDATENRAKPIEGDTPLPLDDPEKTDEDVTLEARD